MRCIFLISIVFALFLSCSTENAPVYKLSTSVVPAESGVVTPEQGNFDEGATVEVKAVPNEGWVFSRFEGDYSSSTNPASFLMNNDKQITVLFEKKNYPLSIMIIGKGTVQEEVVQQKSTDYAHGTMVELSTSAQEGYTFSGWGGDLTGLESPQQLLIDSEKKVTAHFQSKVRNFGGSGSDYGRSIVSTPDGGVVVAGITNSTDWDFDDSKLGELSGLVIKLDQFGRKEWIKAFGGSSSDYVHSVTLADDGGYVIAGSTKSNDGDFDSMNNGGSDIFAVKLDSSGNVIWVNVFGGSGEDGHERVDITTTNDGGFAISGQYVSNDGVFLGKDMGGLDSFVAKLDRQGNNVWLRELGGSGFDSAYSIAELSNGSLALAGISNSNDADFSGMLEGAFNGYVAAISSDGNIEWVKNFGSSSEPEGVYTIDSVNDGGVILSAVVIIENYNGSEINVRVRKLDSLGETEWIRNLGGGFSSHMSIKEVSDNNYLVGLNKTENDTYGMTFHKFDQSGNQIWSKNYSGNGSSFLGSLTPIKNAGFVATGEASSKDGIFEFRESDNQDIWIIPFNSSGEIVSFIGQ